MEKIEQENFLDSKMPIKTVAQSEENASEAKEPAKPEIVQLVPPQEALDEIAKLERQYREIIERENK